MIGTCESEFENGYIIRLTSLTHEKFLCWTINWHSILQRNGHIVERKYFKHEKLLCQQINQVHCSIYSQKYKSCIVRFSEIRFYCYYWTVWAIQSTLFWFSISGYNWKRKKIGASERKIERCLWEEKGLFRNFIDKELASQLKEESGNAAQLASHKAESLPICNGTCEGRDR